MPPNLLDRDVHPGARAWFRESATDLLALTAPYPHLLDRYAVRWVELRTASPGLIVYSDAVQVVAVPYRHPDDWPFTAAPGSG